MTKEHLQKRARVPCALKEQKGSSPATPLRNTIRFPLPLELLIAWISSGRQGNHKTPTPLHDAMLLGLSYKDVVQVDTAVLSTWVSQSRPVKKAAFHGPPSQPSSPYLLPAPSSLTFPEPWKGGTQMPT